MKRSNRNWILLLGSFSVLLPNLAVCQRELIANPITMAGERSLNTCYPGLVTDSLERLGLQVIKVPNGVNPKEFEQQLLRQGLINWACPNQILKLASLPNDPGRSQQWYLNRTSVYGAWLGTLGSSSTVIAVCDAGVATTHPDLAGQCVSGYNSFNGIPEAMGGDISDISSTGHGTQVSGIIAANGNNGLGTVGVGYGLKIMPIRVSNLADGSTTLAKVLDGIIWAADHGAKVVNVSYDGVENAAVQAAGQYLQSQNKSLVWAAGNSNIDLNSFDYPEVVVVGGTSQTDSKAPTSNYGIGVDIYAPSMGIVTLNKNGGYSNAGDGTSFAAPQVAAALGLIYSIEPGISAAEAENRLYRSGRDLGSTGNDPTWGWGRLNVSTAVIHPALTYKVTILPDGPSTFSRATGIADNGDLVGFLQTVGVLRFARWSGTTRLLQPILTLPQPGQDQDADVNSSGTSVITSFSSNTTPPFFRKGFVYNGSFHDMSPDSSTDSYVPSINSLGEYVGYENNPVTGFAKAFVGTGGSKSYPFDTLTGGLWAPFRTWALDIDNSGRILASIDSRGHMYMVDGDFVNELPLLGAYRFPQQMNNYGVCTGRAGTDPAANTYDIGVWNYPFINNNYMVPRPLGYNRADPLCINDSETIGGYVTLPGIDAAYLFQGYQVGFFASMVSNLNLLPAGLQFHRIQDINEMGTIAGWGKESNGANFAFVADPNLERTVKVNIGQIDQTYLGSIPPTLVVEIRTADNLSVISGPSNAAYNGQTLSLQLPIPVGLTQDFRVHISTPRYLSQLVPPINDLPLPPDTAVLYQVTLTAGDIDQDNEIGPGDFSLLVGSFGSSLGDANYLVAADINGDQEVGPADFVILVQNFGMSGDD